LKTGQEIRKKIDGSLNPYFSKAKHKSILFNQLKTDHFECNLREGTIDGHL